MNAFDETGAQRMAFPSFQFAEAAAGIHSSDTSFLHGMRFLLQVILFCFLFSKKILSCFLSFGMILSHVKKADFFKTQVIQL